MKKTVIHLSLALMVTICSVMPFANQAHALGEYDIYIKGESFTWKEFDDGEVVRETGPIFGIGGVGTFYTDPVTLRVRGEIFGGRVNYDGQTTGTSSPVDVETDTDYFGGKIEGTIGVRLMINENTSMEPFTGPAARAWIREIEGTRVGSIRIVETQEEWLTVYAPLGIRIKHRYSDRMSVFMEGGVKLPIYNENEADLTELYGVKVSVKPGRRVAGFAEAGLKWKMLMLSLYYEGMRFSESDPVSKNVSGGTLTVFQPESKADMFGINIGISF